MRDVLILFMVIIALAAVACASKESIETIERMGPQVEQALNGQRIHAKNRGEAYV